MVLMPMDKSFSVKRKYKLFGRTSVRKGKTYTYSGIFSSETCIKLTDNVYFVEAEQDGEMWNTLTGQMIMLLDASAEFDEVRKVYDKFTS